MANTARLALPLIAPEQAQKHITHNEALTLMDGLVQMAVEAIGTVTPPMSPVLGDCYILGTSVTGDWTGHDGNLALWTSGGWRFLTPSEGWLAWDKAVGAAFVLTGSGWTALGATVTAFQNLDLLGVNATADTTNKLTVRSNAAAFNGLGSGDGGTGDIRLMLNREAGGDTASFVFQTGYSARAEIGLPGTDDFTFKVSPDGSTFHTGIRIASGSGFVTFDKLFGAEPSYPVIASGVLDAWSGYLVPSPESGSADTVDTINGGFDGAMLVITGSSGKTLTFGDGTGNLKLGGTRVLDNFEDSLLLIKRGSDWIELSFADNG